MWFSEGPRWNWFLNEEEVITLKSRLYLVKTMDRRAGVKRCFELAEPQGIEGKRVFVKPNFNTVDEAPGSTHNDTLEEILNQLKERRPAALGLGDRSGPPPTEDVLAEKGIPELAARHGAELINFDDLPEEGWKAIGPEGNHWPEGFKVARPVTDADFLVWTPCLKTHQYGGVFTLSLKLAVGVVPKKGTDYMKQLHGSEHMRRMIAEINTQFQPDLIILDGVVAFVDGGPATGTRVDTGVFIAGTDRIAVDAVGLAVLKHAGTKPEIQDRGIFEQEQIARAVELGLGATGPDDIEIVTGDDESEALAVRLREIIVQG